MIDPSIFRAYDIRGIVDTALTEQSVYQIGRAIAVQIHQCGEKTVVVGRDGRLSGQRFSEQLAQGFIDSGINVIEVGCVPTPMTYFAGKTMGRGSCVSITGSHNPSNYNGLKIVVAHQTLSTDRIQALRICIENQSFIDGSGTLTIQPCFEAYAQAIESHVNIARPLKVVVDAGNGVAGDVAPALLQRLGCEVIPLFCEVDGTFPNHHPDPSKPENLVDLTNAVLAHQADVGLAFDGDGDRLGVIDNEGNVINADRQMILYAQSVLERRPQSEIIFDVKCSVHLPRSIESFGGKATMARTGHSFIKQKLQETNAALAGEMSGHIFFNDDWYGFDDALYTAARLLEILAKNQHSIADIFQAIPNSFNTPELNIAFAEGEHHKVMELIIEKADFPDGEISTLDGLRVNFKDCWGLVRASNTTPVLVLRFEGETQAALMDVIDRFKVLISAVAPKATFPNWSI